MKEYVVERGDTLSNLAPRLIGENASWRDLWQYNPQITDPDVIEVGDKIFYPGDVPGQSLDSGLSFKHTLEQMVKEYWYIPIALTIVGFAIVSGSKLQARTTT